jgi:hypothetical protein
MMPLFLLAVLAIHAIACNLPLANRASSQPQAGDWTGSLQFQSENGNTITWVIDFTVSENGKELTFFQAAHYLGELADNTEVSLLWPADTIKIKGGSFRVSMSEFSNYTSYSYEIEGKFVSSTELEGSAEIWGDTYTWTAAPVDPSG